MRDWLTKRWRWRAAAIVAVLYALCVIAPSVALAFADDSVAVHCLTADQLGLAHDHGQDGIGQHGIGHGDHTAQHEHGPKKGHSGSCCGLFCFVALPGTDAAFRVQRAVHSSVAPLLIAAILDGRGADRLIRPPIPLLSL